MSDVLFNRQFAQQEVLRTITLGLAPFIPFSQQYVMEMKAKKENVTMMPDPPMDGQPLDSWWEGRKRDYFKQQPEKEVLAKAPRMDTKEVANKLQILFDKNMGDTPSARTYEQSVVGEILSSVGADRINQMLDELGTPIQKGIDGSNLAKQGPVGGQGFDRLMTDELRTVLGAATGVDLKNVVAIEETESRYAKEVQEGLQGKSGQEAIDQLTKNVETVYGDFNKKLKNLKVNNEGELLKVLKMGYEDPYYAGDSYSKQLLARAIDLVVAGLGNKEYMYTVPVGDTGMAAVILLKTVIEGASPQLKHTLNITETGGHGRLIELMATGMLKLDEAAGQGFLKEIPAMDLLAMNESILTASRVGYIGMMQDVQLDTMMSVGADISMTKGKNAAEGVMGLAPKDMADSIAEQMNEALSESSGKFRNIFLELIAKANKASAAWKSAVDPPLDFEGSKGVWKQGTEKNWQDKVGEDFAVSPFLFIRRKGVASFKPANKAKIY
mgnify:FL=1